MAHSFEYAVLTAIPNPRRGERVNVGVVVFRDDRADVRFMQATYKLRAITGDNWDARLDSAAACLSELHKQGPSSKDILASFELLEPLLHPSDLGWLKVRDEADYEEKISEILKALVALPRRERVEGKSRINTEIAREFRRTQLLARGDETIEDHKVVRDFVVDDEEGLSADFALKNGKLHVASTLDLRKQSASLGDAALKSIVLDKAGKVFKKRVVKIGIYAVDDGSQDIFRPHIRMLRDYADELYNWTDPEGQRQLKKRVFDALGQAGDLM